MLRDVRRTNLMDIGIVGNVRQQVIHVACKVGLQLGDAIDQQLPTSAPLAGTVPHLGRELFAGSGLVFGGRS